MKDKGKLKIKFGKKYDWEFLGERHIVELVERRPYHFLLRDENGEEFLEEIPSLLLTIKGEAI